LRKQKAKGVTCPIGIGDKPFPGRWPTGTGTGYSDDLGTKPYAVTRSTYADTGCPISGIETYYCAIDLTRANIFIVAQPTGGDLTEANVFIVAQPTGDANVFIVAQPTSGDLTEANVYIVAQPTGAGDTIRGLDTEYVVIVQPTGAFSRQSIVKHGGNSTDTATDDGNRSGVTESSARKCWQTNFQTTET